VPVNGNTFHTDYKQWTDTAIDITQQYLQAQGRQKTITKKKILKLQAENAKHLTPKGITILAVHLRVETGDGLTRTFLGRGYGWKSWNKKVDGALVHAMEHMLRDDEIIAYLSE